MSAIPTSSILSDLKNDSRSGILDGSIPTFSQEDLTYLSSLPQENFKSFQNSLIERIEDEGGMTKLEEIEDENYTRIFYALDGHEGMDQLLEFAQLYIESDGGWNSIQNLIPAEITDEQSKIFIGLAVYIDKVGRPLYSEIQKKSELSNDRKICKLDAAIKLSLLGVNISVDVLVDIMTGGTGAIFSNLEVAALGFELSAIWLDYEVCNNRWH